MSVQHISAVLTIVVEVNSEFIGVVQWKQLSAL